MKRVLAIAMALSIPFPAFLWPFSASAAEQEIRISDITEPLVPNRVLGGDREFDGHGPDIETTTNLRIGDGGRALYADVYFHAKETTSDWSETEGRWSRKVWEAKDGQTIKRILSDDFSETSFRSQQAGFQILGPTEDWLVLVKWIIDIAKTFTDKNEEGKIDIPDGDFADRLPCDTVEQCQDIFEKGLLSVSKENHVHIKPSTRGNLVSTFMIVGDTGGDDISNDDNPKDDTRIAAIGFNRVRVELEGTPTGSTLKTGISLGGIGRSSGALVSSNTCAAQIQGKIAWDYNGNKGWNQGNIDRLCKGAEQSIEPSVCFNQVMHGGINWGGGTRWSWQNALDLCEGTQNASLTTSCFQQEIQKPRPWPQAIQTCSKQ